MAFICCHLQDRSLCAFLCNKCLIMLTKCVGNGYGCACNMQIRLLRSGVSSQKYTYAVVIPETLERQQDQHGSTHGIQHQQLGQTACT